MRKFVTINESVIQNAINFIRQIDVSDPQEITIKSADRRSLEQNAKLWPMLDDVAKQVEWHGMWLQPNDWKDMFTASLSNQQVVPNLEGTGFVVVGGSTSLMSKKKFADLIEIIYCFGAERGIVWSEPIQGER